MSNCGNLTVYSVCHRRLEHCLNDDICDLTRKRSLRFAVLTQIAVRMPCMIRAKNLPRTQKQVIRLKKITSSVHGSSRQHTACEKRLVINSITLLLRIVTLIKDVCTKIFCLIVSFFKLLM